MSSGEGFIGVFEQRDAGHYQLVAKIPTVPAASTSFFGPEFVRRPARKAAGVRGTAMIRDT
jgi:hypothetical protein